MKHTAAFFITLLLLTTVLSPLRAEEITYRITEFNASTGTFTLAAAGMRPQGSWAEFESEWGSTAGNRFNQIPRGRQVALWLYGWQGCSIERIILSMSSNNKAGAAGMQLLYDENIIFEQKVADFNSEAWFGRWVSKDIAAYVELEKGIPNPQTVLSDQDVCILIKGGNSEGSVYLDAVTIEYTPREPSAVESPLGWIYEKIEAKGKVNEGDVVMLHRNGDAAGDIDGMASTHYLDAIGVASTSKVDDPYIQLFTLHKTAEGYWTLTNQHGERLGARGAQNLAWDEGTDTWTITMGYDGATIASTNTKYGTLRYNAPSGNYPRFWNYTSKTLPLPNLYRRSHQVQPILSTSLTLPASQRNVFLDQDTLVLRPQLQPSSVTNQRIHWESSNESIASVRSGIVELFSLGQVSITARSADGQTQATCIINITERPTAIGTLSEQHTSDTGHLYDLSGRPLKSIPRNTPYIHNGHRLCE